MVLISPIGVKTPNDEVFEPDLIFISLNNRDIIKTTYIKGSPDLVIEVLSPSTKHRDLNIKMEKYGVLGIKEYWIVDPEKNVLTVYVTIEGQMKKVFEFNYLNDEIQSKTFEDIRFQLELQSY